MGAAHRLHRDGQWSEKFSGEAPSRLNGDPKSTRNDNYQFVGLFAFDSEELENKMQSHPDVEMVILADTAALGSK